MKPMVSRILLALAAPVTLHAQSIVVGKNVHVSRDRANLVHDEITIAADPRNPNHLIACVLVGIVPSLGSALYHLSRRTGDSKKLVRARPVRVGLSGALFVIRMAAWALGFISPHGFKP